MGCSSCKCSACMRPPTRHCATRRDCRRSLGAPRRAVPSRPACRQVHPSVCVWNALGLRQRAARPPESPTWHPPPRGRRGGAAPAWSWRFHHWMWWHVPSMFELRDNAESVTEGRRRLTITLRLLARAEASERRPAPDSASLEEAAEVQLGSVELPVAQVLGEPRCHLPLPARCHLPLPPRWHLPLLARCHLPVPAPPSFPHRVPSPPQKKSAHLGAPSRLSPRRASSRGHLARADRARAYKRPARRHTQGGWREGWRVACRGSRHCRSGRS